MSECGVLVYGLFSHEGKDRDGQSGSCVVQETSTAAAGLTGKLGVVCESSRLRETEHTGKLTHRDHSRTGRILGLGKWGLLLTFSQTVNWGECWGPGVRGTSLREREAKNYEVLLFYLA